LPPLVMSTEAALVAPGLIAARLRIECPALESVTTIVPVVIRLPGLADVELKFAPEPAATAVAIRSALKATSSRRGVAAACEKRERGSMSSLQSPVASSGVGATRAEITGVSNQATSSASGSGRLK
jgi:hypothetical protein